MGPQSNDSCLYKEGEMGTQTQRQRRGHVMIEAEIGVICKLRNSRSHPKLEDTGKDPPQIEASRGKTP